MQEKEIKQLAEWINKNFKEPYLKKGIVDAQACKLQTGTVVLSLRIGPRDAQIDSNMQHVGAGTRLAGQIVYKKSR